VIAFSKLVKRPVYGSAGRLFGDLEDLQIDEERWLVESLVVRLESDAVAALGLETPFWRRARLTIPARLAREDNGVIVIGLTLDEFATLLDSDAIDADVN